MKPFNKKYPPVAGTMTVEEFEASVDSDSFPKCSVCENPIYHPDFYDEEMCGPCTTGESETLMLQEDEVDWSIYANMPN
jgi:hypothetical protein